MKIRLNLWLERQFEPAPKMCTALRWIKQGKIYPTPVKIGKAYYVDQDAVFNDGIQKPRLVHRIA